MLFQAVSLLLTTIMYKKTGPRKFFKRQKYVDYEDEMEIKTCNVQHHSASYLVWISCGNKVCFQDINLFQTLVI